MATINETRLCDAVAPLEVLVSGPFVGSVSVTWRDHSIPSLFAKINPIHLIVDCCRDFYRGGIPLDMGIP